MDTNLHNMSPLRWSRICMLLLLTLAASAGFAQTKSQPKMFRWVDDNGVVHYDDHVPPKYAGKDREILNSEGVAVGFQQGALTDAQRAEAARKKAAKDKAEAAHEQDRRLLQTYGSVDDIEDLRDRRLELMASQIKVTQLYLENLQDRLTKLKRQASPYKPYSQKANAPPLPKDLANDIARTTSSIGLYQKTLTHAQVEREHVKADFAADIKRFKELKKGG